MLGLWSVWAPISAFAQEDDEEPFRPGLIRELELSSGERVRELAMTPLFTAEEVAAGGVKRIEWIGLLDFPDTGAYRLAVFGSGRLELKLGGRTVLERSAKTAGWVESAELNFEFGPQPLQISFEPIALPGSSSGELALFWTGPNFGLEPISPRALLHPREQTPYSKLASGRLLARALRCEACHHAEEPKSLLAPSLRQLAGQIDREWLVHWLTSAPVTPKAEEGALPLVRRMPHFGLKTDDAEAITHFLIAKSAPLASEPPPPAGAPPFKPVGKSKNAPPPPPPPSVKEGERLFLTLGCLACHRWNQFGDSGLFGGGDLTAIASKRPAEYFERWLSNPHRLNEHARMPVFALSSAEQKSLALFLAAQTGGVAPIKPGDLEQQRTAEQLARGSQLIAEHRCGTCHLLPGDERENKTAPPNALRKLSAQSDWKRSCAAPIAALNTPGLAGSQPRFTVSAEQASALQIYFSLPVSVQAAAFQSPSKQAIIELNCLACHARDGNLATTLPKIKLADKLSALAQHHTDLAPLLPAMTPPSLNSVGDKLTDVALQAAIGRSGAAHRDYLLVRMPRFKLTSSELQSIGQAFIAEDRIPAGAPVTNFSKLPKAEPLAVAARQTAGPRLVGTDGFGCTSCHQVGTVKAEKAPLNARGPSLSMLSERIRREWYERWLRNPARIVPRMEMPSVQTPVRGVLENQLSEQISAVWETLNIPGFEPPLPNPVRVLRFATNEFSKNPHLVTDLVQDGASNYTRPALVGLPNRHNLLLDLAAGRLVAWRQGDLARQRTKGKSWYWEFAGSDLLRVAGDAPEFQLAVGSKVVPPMAYEQNLWSLESWESAPAAITLRSAVRFAVSDSKKPRRIEMVQTFASQQAGKAVNGVVREITFTGLAAGEHLVWQAISPDDAQAAAWNTATNTLRLGEKCAVEVGATVGVQIQYQDAGRILISTDTDKPLKLTAKYLSNLPADEYHLPSPPLFAVPQGPVELAPGWTAERVPISEEFLPTALAFDERGRLFFASLKGQVVRVDLKGKLDANGVLPTTVLLDGLPAPYGLSVSGEQVDVCAKYAIIRTAADLQDSKSPHQATVVASGWGYTADYHDWAVGLPRTKDGGYFLAIPCQQDNREAAAASYRGTVLQLKPRQPTPDDPRAFSLQVISRGHRFPMGLAENRSGELFVTDNQGNFNPFNELNHVRPGAHFGFINALDRKQNQPAPQLAPPAVDIPHPWTRSVNGICFLETPEPLRQKGKPVFGPWEGHLVGCEYDTRRLVRMSLDFVRGSYQGCCYPLSETPSDPAHGLQGPVNCAVSPSGELFVGSFRESGWGAGANVGEIVRCKLNPAALPCGIAEVKATSHGFRIVLAQPVDAEKAGDLQRYSVASYRRESTPAYGGPDLDRRTEIPWEVEVEPDRRAVTLKFRELRAGFVYELRLKSLSPGEQPFYPAEAHYTLRQIP
jgi:glucose/arabinose dehydrogenase/mono/diheme cytochrome c family protein